MFCQIVEKFLLIKLSPSIVENLVMVDVCTWETL